MNAYFLLVGTTVESVKTVGCLFDESADRIANQELGTLLNSWFESLSGTTTVRMMMVTWEAEVKSGIKFDCNKEWILISKQDMALLVKHRYNPVNTIFAHLFFFRFTLNNGNFESLQVQSFKSLVSSFIVCYIMWHCADKLFFIWKNF